MKSVAVFCGSSLGNFREFQRDAQFLGEAIAKKGWTLVYGGAKVGLMGAVADAALASGAQVIGVLPRFLSAKEIIHEGLSDLILVETMHERKAKMNELSDGIIALPGGFGTLEELFEMLTWGQLSLHEKPVGLLNTKKFYHPLLRCLKTMVKNGFVKQEHAEMLLSSSDVENLLLKMEDYTPPTQAKWIVPPLRNTGTEYV